MIDLRALSACDMEQVRLWRNTEGATLRTPFVLTEEQQQDYYTTVICDRKGTTRYFGFWAETRGRGDELVGYGGIENIQWENRLGEISVLIGPEFRQKGLGREAVEKILDQAFKVLNLHAVWGECYTCTPALLFWEKLAEKYKAFTTELPHRKYWNGAYWPSLYFMFYRENWT